MASTHIFERRMELAEDQWMAAEWIKENLEHEVLGWHQGGNPNQYFAHCWRCQCWVGLFRNQFSPSLVAWQPDGVCPAASMSRSPQPRVFGPRRTLQEDIETIRRWMRDNCRHEFGPWHKAGNTAKYHAHCLHCETWIEMDRSGDRLLATGYPRRPCPAAK